VSDVIIPAFPVVSG